ARGSRQGHQPTGPPAAEGRGLTHPVSPVHQFEARSSLAWGLRNARRGDSELTLYTSLIFSALTKWRIWPAALPHWQRASTLPPAGPLANCRVRSDFGHPPVSGTSLASTHATLCCLPFEEIPTHGSEAARLCRRRSAEVADRRQQAGPRRSQHVGAARPQRRPR